MIKTSAQLRQTFLDFYASKQHQIVPSSSLVPGNDATLLFTNAGMVPFKDVFLGAESRSYTRATSSQRCVRAGGKHNDLENVGYTARHHTFFEMLGNFSFGDYFKEDAIRFAWEFLTVKLALPKEKLLVTVYDSDEEAFAFWRDEIGIPVDKIIRIGDKSPSKKYESDNFWSMGDTGPCGPCSEIFYDHGENIFGGPPGSPDEDGDRFIEIWNLVFMQYNRHADGTMENLPKPSVDTGMGLERISAIMQGVHSNYEIDIFQGLIKDTAELLQCNDLEHKSLRVIADHIRSCSFLIADGVMPSNEGRGYVLRRIIRRAVRHGHKLEAKSHFFHRLVVSLGKQMGEAYPELISQQAVIEKILRIEEEQFGRTLDRGMILLEDILANLKGDTISGDDTFKLYDTYGFPADLTADIARERQLKVDHNGFDIAMGLQRERAQQASQFGSNYNDQLKSDHNTQFKGYTRNEFSATIVELFNNEASVAELKAGEQGIVILDKTPFYAESGGQAGDQGLLHIDDGIFEVHDTTKMGNAFAHKGIARVNIGLNRLVKAEINTERRAAIVKNHTATHLLHAALRSVLGEHVTQKGSLCDAEKLRFDFSHFEGVTAQELQTVERLVNQEIRNNLSRETNLMQIDEAKEKGAMALFGEKYDDEVRVVTLGGFSTELCGGVHVERTGDIGFVKIVSESGIAAGVRRIEAVSGECALAFTEQQGSNLSLVASMVKSDVASMPGKVEQLISRGKQLEKEIQILKQQVAAQAGSDLISEAVDVNGVKVLIADLAGTESKALRGMMDELKNKIGSGIILLGTASDGKVGLIAGVTKDLTGQVKAGDLVNAAAQHVGGKGGGRPDMAQAGGNKPENLPMALDTAKAWLIDQLS
ncbi:MULTISPECIES: alanine--tRNA ligase [unclassified Colwellia]|uniref:alanine--tRNA ligase n=1 Tax=unclassified Colwellia TaxID=196834 RepID=UPI0015F636E9|nr:MULTISPECIES: alanine--tRNA ligase [unclassified Colwellia]MBA6364077.1 alanine--tRNA ligase [Colwellia sp. BRX8-8]MBA6347656.1 alanine--tRNA ligase [Colwellia sp. BRX8-9]MBA6351573.1 alanine--tRNA ligase [Colwellia sp. BRX9-1]MBA6371814.1 alanine--tRNA ligase [Colwellia sp. BRX8-4]MBA6378188.1 alanine--tRNA ligase [Colwellia sp. BRX10-7]